MARNLVEAFPLRTAALSAVFGGVDAALANRDIQKGHKALLKSDALKGQIGMVLGGVAAELLGWPVDVVEASITTGTALMAREAALRALQNRSKTPGATVQGYAAAVSQGSRPALAAAYAGAPTTALRSQAPTLAG